MAFPFSSTPDFLHWAQTRTFKTSLLETLGPNWHLGDLQGYIYKDGAYIAMYRTSGGRLIYMMDYQPTVFITEDLQEAEHWVWEHYSKFQQELKTDERRP